MPHPALGPASAEQRLPWLGTGVEIVVLGGGGSAIPCAAAQAEERNPGHYRTSS